MNYIQAIVIIIGWLDKLSIWLAKKHNIERIDNAIKAIDNNDDIALSKQLHELADKIATRKKSS